MERKNILLISLDNVRYDFLAYPDNKWIKTPNFRDFAKECFQFDNHFIQIPFTPPSHYSLLHGTDLITQPRVLKVPETLKCLLGDDLPKFLKRKKYLTAAIVSALVLRRDLCPLTHADFDIYDDFFETQVQENPSKSFLLNSIWGRNKLLNYLAYYSKRDTLKKRFPELPLQMGDVTTQKVVSFIEKNQKRNWFLWVHYFDAHVATSVFRQYMKDKYGESFDDAYGHIAPPEYLYMYDEDEETKDNYIRSNITTDKYFAGKTNKYAGCVSYLDKLFGSLVDFLKANGLYDNTVIILTSDHGTPLGKYGHASKVTNVYDCTVKVPLFIKVDGRQKKIEHLTQHSDLLPLIKRLFTDNEISVDEPRKTIFLESPAGFSRPGDTKMYGMRTNSAKFILELRYHDSKVESRHYYFDINKDPYENNNMFDTLDEVHKNELIDTLKGKFHQLTGYRDVIAEFISATDDEEIKRRLKELGYS